MLFANQSGEGSGAFSKRRLKAFAETLGLEMNQFNACFDSGRYAADVNADVRLAESLGVHSTPTVLVDGRQASEPLDYAALSQAIETALAGSP